MWIYFGCTLRTGTGCFWLQAASAASHTETQYGGQRGPRFHCSTADDRCMSHMANRVGFVSMDYCRVWTNHITASPCHEGIHEVTGSVLMVTIKPHRKWLKEAGSSLGVGSPQGTTVCQCHHHTTAYITGLLQSRMEVVFLRKEWWITFWLLHPCA